MEEKGRVLIIEDEKSIVDILYHSLCIEGYITKFAYDGKNGMKIIEEFYPDVILLDLMLPDIDGYELCRKITKEYMIPIIMVTARNDITDKINGLELGADDYVTKPFDIREVIARVKTCLRRKEQINKQGNIIMINNEIKIYTESRTVYRNGEEILLKPKEYDVLYLFASNKNRVFSRDEILDRVWDMDYEGGLRTVDVHIQRVRKKISTSKDIIETIYGIGYKLRD